MVTSGKGNSGSNQLKEVKLSTGVSIFILAKCLFCRSEMDISVNDKDEIESSCPECMIWKKY